MDQSSPIRYGHLPGLMALEALSPDTEKLK